MGIKNLNRFLKENCSKNAIRKIEFHQLNSKTVVIDASIYMYKYMAENALIENMYLLISMLLSNNITPLFVFDGKPPPEKNELLRQRKADKTVAESKYNELLIEYNNTDNKQNNEKQKMMQELNELKHKFVRITNNDKCRVKQLLTSYGVMYYESVNEADEVCAYMVQSGKAWACLSDDMDMFVYGCTRVLRNVSLLQKSVILYDTPIILKELCMPDDHFKQIMVLSGTDYNMHTSTTLDNTISWYTKYKNWLLTNKPTDETTFYKWLLVNCNYITDIDALNNICDLFTVNHIYKEPVLKDIEISLGKCNHHELHDIMEQEGFVFT